MKLLRHLTLTLFILLTLLTAAPSAMAVDNDNLVEQVQSVHRLSQALSWDSLNGLMAALNSPIPLARRKASQCLLDLVKATPCTERDKSLITEKIQPELKHSDPVVQHNLQQVINTLQKAKPANASSAVLNPPTLANQDPDGTMLSDSNSNPEAPIPDSAILLLEWSESQHNTAATPVIYRSR